MVLIGDTTCGKPYGFTPTHNCATTYYTIQFSGANYKGFGEYSDGLTPTPTPQFSADVKGCPIADDFDHQLGDTSEALLSTAIYHITNDSCPEVPQNVKQQPASYAPNNETGFSLEVPQSLYNTNMDLTWPSKGDIND